MAQKKVSIMWILDKNGTTLYDVNQCKEFYIVDCLNIEACYGKTLKNENCRVLGEYENHIEARWVFENLVDWLENPGEVKVFKMPFEMPTVEEDNA